MIQDSADRKVWLTLQAELVLGGYHAALTEGDDGRPLLVVSRWAATRSFDDLDAATTWAAQVLGNGRAGRGALCIEGDRRGT